MKTVKRIIAVLLLFVTMFAVGYLVFTGNRQSSYSYELRENITEYSLTEQEFHIMGGL